MRQQHLLLGVPLVCAALGTDGPRPGFNNVPGGTTRYAAFSILDAGATALAPAVGELHKHSANPLFTGTNEWEHNINNGYSSVLYSGDDPAIAPYRVYYSAADSQFSGSIPGESAGSATLYAESRDGLTGWSKPHLGRFAFNGSSGVPSAANNILFDGTTALAVYDDGYAAAQNASQRFKIWGNLPGLETAPTGRQLGYTAQLGGTAVSADGLVWTDYRRLQDPSSSKAVKGTWRFDAAANLYYDLKQGRYVGTNRAFRPCDSCGTCPIWWNAPGEYGCQGTLSSTCTAQQCNRTVRAIGTSSSSAGDEFQRASWGPNTEVHADHDDPTHQYYSQVSFPYYNGFLGILSIFSAGDPPNVFGKGKVHCELAWSADGDKYERIAPGTDFVPLGSINARDFDSHGKSALPSRPTAAGSSFPPLCSPHLPPPALQSASPAHTPSSCTMRRASTIWAATGRTTLPTGPTRCTATPHSVWEQFDPTDSWRCAPARARRAARARPRLCRSWQAGGSSPSRRTRRQAAASASASWRRACPGAWRGALRWQNATSLTSPSKGAT
jgi:hypothetical protein